MIKTCFTVIVFLLSLLLIETAVLANIVYLPVVPDIMLISVMYLGLKNGQVTGETTGFLSGLMIDFLSGAPLGLNCLVRTIAGYLCGLFAGTLNSSGVLIPALLGFCITVLKVMLLNIISFFYPGSIILTYNFFSLQFAAELGLNTVAAPILFAVFSLFKSLTFKSGNRL
jgi:rod shape-determining protein MreD